MSGGQVLPEIGFHCLYDICLDALRNASWVQKPWLNAVLYASVFLSRTTYQRCVYCSWSLFHRSWSMVHGSWLLPAVIHESTREASPSFAPPRAGLAGSVPREARSIDIGLAFASYVELQCCLVASFPRPPAAAPPVSEVVAWVSRTGGTTHDFS